MDKQEIQSLALKVITDGEGIDYPDFKELYIAALGDQKFDDVMALCALGYLQARIKGSPSPQEALGLLKASVDIISQADKGFFEGGN